MSRYSHRKGIKERQVWWENLPDTERQKYINSKVKAKQAFRNNRSIALMKPYAGQYNCKDCIHGKTGSCTDNLENGCEYFEDLITGRSARFLIGT